MGMFSEIHAEYEALGYEKILMKAIKLKNKDIFDFCQAYLYSNYISILGETWRTSITDNEKIIKDAFEINNGEHK